jgi:hypothetical protein
MTARITGKFYRHFWHVNQGEDYQRLPSKGPMLADAIVVVHFLIVLFVLAGVPLVYLGVGEAGYFIGSLSSLA